jgi:hypothetical protein
MKTPREVLLTRHKAAEPKLDALRERALATLSGPTEERSAVRQFIELCRNCFHVPQFAWGGLAAAWLVIIALNFAARDSASRQPVAFTQNRPPVETLQAVREQKRLLAELTGLGEKPESETRRFVPRPRSEQRHEIIMA